MRSQWSAVALVSPLLLVLMAGTLFAGVVVGETSIGQFSNGATFSVRRTVYVQGNKQRVDGERVATITDLDERVVYVIDKEERVYAQLPLTALSPGQSGNLKSETVDLNKTGKT